MFFDPMYFVFLAPAFLLMMWAQWKTKSAFHQGLQVPAHLTGAAAAQLILQRAGINDVHVEETPGMLSDHYDPTHKVLRLSPDVYRTRTASAVGIAAHEAGHAIQDAKRYAPLVLRNAAVPAAQYGPTIFMILFFAGMFIGSLGLMKVGVIAFAGVAVFQLINLPVEFDASNRAKALLVEHQMIDPQSMTYVNDVLNSAAWTYVAGTLQSVLQVAYYALMVFGGGRSDD